VIRPDAMSATALQRRGGISGCSFEQPSRSVGDLPLLMSSREIQRYRIPYRSHFPMQRLG